MLQGMDTSSAQNENDPTVAFGVLGDFWIKQKARLFVSATCAVRFVYKSTLQNSNPLGYGCRTKSKRGRCGQVPGGKGEPHPGKDASPKTHSLAVLPSTFSLKNTKTTHVHTAAQHDKRRPDAKKKPGHD